MTATDELRHMLDARGVEWDDASIALSMDQWKTSFTSFTGEEVTISAYDEPKCLMGTMVFHTPEQAIAATLGRGTCELEINTDMTAIRCSKCGYVLPKGTNLMGVRYCAGCGRKVVDE